MNEACVWQNGDFRRHEEAAVSIHDGAFLHGAGLYETIHVHAGRAFQYDAHLARMKRSAATIIRPLADDVLPTAEQAAELAARNGLTHARLRLTLSAGPMTAPTGNGGDAPTVCLTAAELGSYPAALYDKGVTVMIAEFKRSPLDPLARHKTTCHLDRLMALRAATRHNCAEALWFTTDNLLAEGCISNVFVVRQGRLLTPSTDGPLLPGTARALALELAAEMGIATEELNLTINDLLDADEVFLTNAIMTLLPVCRVERRDIGAASPGEVTKRVLSAYRERMDRECEEA